MAGAGMAAGARGEHASGDDAKRVQQLFAAAGEAVVVDESLMDAVTAVSGSGPAYLFYLAEAMEAAARDMGLGDHARLLVSQTLFGAAKLLKEQGDTSGGAAELRRRVTSPGGTTHAAITHLEGNKSIDVIVNAIKAAEARGKELGA